jgi:hypothetical protein
MARYLPASTIIASPGKNPDLISYLVRAMVRRIILPLKIEGGLESKETAGVHRVELCIGYAKLFALS